jgi:hypothetical protein
VHELLQDHGVATGAVSPWTMESLVPPAPLAPATSEEGQGPKRSTRLSERISDKALADAIETAW